MNAPTCIIIIIIIISIICACIAAHHDLHRPAPLLMGDISACPLQSSPNPPSSWWSRQSSKPGPKLTAISESSLEKTLTLVMWLYPASQLSVSPDLVTFLKRPLVDSTVGRPGSKVHWVVRSGYFA
ncbi:uncharacterized protein FMAN_08797 [Fusarium mangiferae]|uniref:Uncharacterized protein n=1 Tax=Fusarium mangiferae TaxID=192010 RepID=A0A1L7T531_FUSMA|nr:uncharacterized protein FMAN_08797 [Fusarium mangiferae]CVK90407.1 uncharacterized protein FMAN_08797 [Fusarium mangiferae]